MIGVAGRARVSVRVPDAAYPFLGGGEGRGRSVWCVGVAAVDMW